MKAKVKRKVTNVNKLKRIVGIVILCVYSLFTVTQVTVSSYQTYTQLKQEQNISQLYKQLSPSVAVIFTEGGQGSGVYIDKGIILTNYHVVADAKTFYVTVKTEDKMETGRIIYGDPEDDIALVEVRNTTAVPVKLGNSLYTNVGDEVISIGSSLGLENTLGVGYVTAKNRETTLAPFIGIMQISTGIYPGNSGGGLFNLKGELIGITYAGIENAAGLGFVIPINYIKYVLTNKIK